MKKIILLLFSLSLITACKNAKQNIAPNSDEVIIQIDNEHNHVTGNDKISYLDYAPIYVIEPCAKLRIDAGDYFSTNNILNSNAVNSIHISLGKDAWYRAPWDGKGEIVLEADNLKNIRGTLPFDGLVSGKTNITLVIGLDDYPRERTTLSPVWASMINVK